MSSGNPFRASQLYKHSASSPVPQVPPIHTSSSVPEAYRADTDYGLQDSIAPPPKTKKQVRIVSPTTSIFPHPDADDVYGSLHNPPGQRPSQTGHAGSPPSAASASPAYSSPTAYASTAQDVADVQSMVAADMVTIPRPYADTTQAALASSSVPANPFSRTLASLEPERGSAEDRTSAERTVPGNSKASLDVESFKNLLLTGKPTPRPSAPLSQTSAALSTHTGSHFESSSSTDTSSISRQSLFEPPQEVHTESPRTSYEMAESDEDENMGLVSEVKKGKKKPPPAPKHRHGKLVTPRQPQIVSFESFAASEPASSPVTRPRDNSDVNKPLPPTPIVLPAPLHISTQDITPYEQASVLLRTSESLTPADVPTPQKKAPPPVPLARRQSQLRTSTTGNRSRTNSSLTMSSQHSVDAISSPTPSNHDPMLGAKPPPPPPPSRHGARLAHISTSNANSSSTELPQRSMSMRTAKAPQSWMSSRRSTTDSEPPSPVPGVNRASSMSSNRNTQRTVSNESTGNVMPPPPPPPRRQQSNRSSLDQQRPHVPSSSPTESRRTSTEYRRTSLENRRTSIASESSLRREYAPTDEKVANEYALYSPMEESENTLAASGAPLTETRSDSSTILDDMEKFQREIDALRNRYKKAG